MCYKKPECPHYWSNVASGSHNACGNCIYIKQLNLLQRRCKIGLLVAFVVFAAVGYLMF